jgi:glycine/sarcosine/betaine reductase complex component A
MDVQSQDAIKHLAEQHGKDKLLVLLGAPDAESAEIAAETVVLGDPSYAGPLAGAQLGLVVHHVLDPEIRNEVPPEIWEEQIGVMADVLNAEALTAAVRRMRERGAGG